MPSAGRPHRARRQRTRPARASLEGAACGRSARCGTQSGWGLLGWLPEQAVPAERSLRACEYRPQRPKFHSLQRVKHTQRPLAPPPWDTSSKQMCSEPGCPGVHEDSAAPWAHAVASYTRHARPRKPRNPAEPQRPTSRPSLVLPPHACARVCTPPCETSSRTHDGGLRTPQRDVGRDPASGPSGAALKQDGPS